jgi:hypothetical protein
LKKFIFEKMNRKMGNILSKIEIDSFQLFEKTKKNFRRFISYNDFNSMCGSGEAVREIKTPVEARYPPHACVLEYTKIPGKFLDQVMGRNDRDNLDRKVNS